MVTPALRLPSQALVTLGEAIGCRTFVEYAQKTATECVNEMCSEHYRQNPTSYKLGWILVTVLRKTNIVAGEWT